MAQQRAKKASAPPTRKADLAAEVERLQERLRSLESENARQSVELREALDNQTATAEVLRTIAGSPAEAERALETICAVAAKLFGAPNVGIHRVEGGVLRYAATAGESTTAVRAAVPEKPLDPESLTGAAILERRQIAVADAADPGLVQRWPKRLVVPSASLVITPLLREGQAIGAMVVARGEVRPFTEKELKQLQNFADQAVIAIENARLLSELRESLDRQTATSEVLSAISGRPGELEPVFGTILDSALRLCDAATGNVYRIEDGQTRVVAMRGAPPEALAYFRDNPVLSLPPGSPIEATVRLKEPSQAADLSQSPAYAARSPPVVAAVELCGARTSLLVPMIREGEVIGLINVYRRDVRPFEQKHIDVLAGFADQAVIAIENARLLSELRESLDRQTAMSEVLGVISSSPGELGPVFGSILRNATQLCEAVAGTLFLRDPEGEGFRVAGVLGMTSSFNAAYGPVDSYTVFSRHASGPLPRAVWARATVHVADLSQDEGAAQPRLAAAIADGVRSAFVVPMLRDDEVIGAISLYRREVRPFADKQIELVENFARQAVIAIENARLLAELRESLDRQTATADILRVIASTPGDPTRALNTIAETAVRMFDASSVGIRRLDAGMLRPVATAGPGSSAIRDALPAYAPDPALPSGRCVIENRQVQVDDMRKFPLRLAGTLGTDMAGSSAFTPLSREGEAIGLMVANREEVRPFGDKDLELMRNFADQAVIAIENARLLSELHESLDRQTATSEVLGVISSSPGEVNPVFDTILDSAMQLCNAQMGHVFRVEGEMVRLAAMRGAPPEAEAAFRQRGAYRPDEQSGLGQALHRKAPVLIDDLREHPGYAARNASNVVLVETVGVRTVLLVPMMKDEGALGVILLYRREVQPFSEKHIALVENFAKQAVIAIENARLLSELRESLDRQTATADILRVIASTPGDPTRALDTIAETAVRMFGASNVGIRRLEGDVVRVVGAAGPVASAMRERFPEFKPDQHPTGARCLRENRQIHIEDVASEPENSFVGGAILANFGMRTQAYTPLTREGAAIGYMNIQRSEVRPFQPHELELMRGFADQAVIAIENARLLSELRESLERQTATSDVLGVISSSPGELQPVFEAMLDNAVRICGVSQGALWRIEDGAMHAEAFRGWPPGAAARLRDSRPESGSAPARMMETQKAVHTHDVAASDLPVAKEVAERFGVRTQLWVPMVKGEAVVGAFSLAHREVRPFTDKHIELVENFAAQAVIAIENARLLSELRESLDRQTATAEVLGVISASPGELKPVFETMLENAVRICEATEGSLWHIEDGVLFSKASRGRAPELAAFTAAGLRPTPESPPGEMLLSKATVHVHDAALLSDSLAREAFERGGIRTVVWVPMVKDREVVGAFSLNRREVRPFADKQIELVENFAAQAVIAIENARLLTELRESLDRQTATADILRVIASTPGDPTRALDTIAETAARMFDAESVGFRRVEGQVLRHIAAAGPYSTAFSETLPELPLDPANLASQSVLENRQIHVEDLDKDPNYQELRKRLGSWARTAAFTPLSREGVAIGTMIVNRNELRPFRPDELELMRGFADQAVIAIENARLLTELRESLDRQTATADILRVIASTPGDPRRALDTIAETAVRMFNASSCGIRRLEGNILRDVAVTGPAASRIRQAVTDMQIGDPAPMARCVRENRQLAFDDFAASLDAHGSEAGRLARELQIRSNAFTPLTQDGRAIGVMVVNRDELRPFQLHELELMSGFADQAVIAIENARLLNELRARTDELARRQAELRVTFDNMGDGVAMFDADQRLVSWNRNLQEILDIPDSLFAEPRTYRDWIAYLISRGEFGAVDFETEWPRYEEMIGQHRRVERARPDGRVLEIRINPVPGGGFVAIYGDITERKRAEEQIRVARDAAEHALSELKAAQANLIQAEKMASLGQLTAGIAHEIKNPLNFVNNFAGLSVELLGELKEEAQEALNVLSKDKRTAVDEVVEMLTSNLEKIAEHGKRADGIVKSMLAHSRGGSGERQSVNINALVEESLNLAYHGARAQDQNFNITLERNLDATIGPIELVPQDITRVFLNLFGNGFYAANKWGKDTNDPSFKPVLKVTTRDVGGDVEIRIRDNGIGIPPDIRDRLFQPFFTTKPTGEGTGLGLSISYEIVTQQHGGTIDVDSRVGEYTEFTIRLPRRFGASVASNVATAGRRA